MIQAGKVKIEAMVAGVLQRCKLKILEEELLILFFFLLLNMCLGCKK